MPASSGAARGGTATAAITQTSLLSRATSSPTSLVKSAPGPPRLNPLVQSTDPVLARTQAKELARLKDVSVQGKKGGFEFKTRSSAKRYTRHGLALL